MLVRKAHLIAVGIAVIALIGGAHMSHGQPTDIDGALTAFRAGDYESAFRAAERLAPAGDVVAQTMLGILYWGGHGTDQDLPAADEWLSRAAEQGHVLAMRYLADLHYDDFYSLDDGRLKNRSLAVDWYRRAAEAGDSYSQRRLAIALTTGQGVEEDRGAALDWMERSIQAGDRLSMFRLGYMYESGQLGRSDFHKALDLYRQAIRHGEVRSARQAIELLRDRRSPVFDLEEAYFWALIASQWWPDDPTDGRYFVSVAETVHREQPRTAPPDSARVTLGIVDEQTYREELDTHRETVANPENWPFRLDEAARRRSEEAAHAIIARWPEAPAWGQSIDD